MNTWNRLKRWWWTKCMMYCVHRAQEDFEDNHFEGMDRWDARAAVYVKKLYPPLTLTETLVQ